MKLRIALIVGLAVLFALPAPACGPMPSGGTSNSGGAGTMSPGREQWTRKRIKHLKQEMQQYKGADRTARNIDRALGAADGNGGRVMFPEGSSAAVRRQYMINRYEFLALKAERGKATAKDIAEMRALQAALLTPR